MANISENDIIDQYKEKRTNDLQKKIESVKTLSELYAIYKEFIIPKEINNLLIQKILPLIKTTRDCWDILREIEHQITIELRDLILAKIIGMTNDPHECKKVLDQKNISDEIKKAALKKIDKLLALKGF